MLVTVKAGRLIEAGVSACKRAFTAGKATTVIFGNRAGSAIFNSPLVAVATTFLGADRRIELMSKRTHCAAPKFSVPLKQTNRTAMLLRAFFWQQFTEYRVRWTPQLAQQAILLALFIRYGIPATQREALRQILQDFRRQPNSHSFRAGWRQWLDQNEWKPFLQDWPLQEEVDGQVELLQAALDLAEMDAPGIAFAQVLRESLWDLRRQAAPLPPQLAQLLWDSLRLPANTRVMEWGFSQHLAFLAPSIPTKQALFYATENAAAIPKLGELALHLLKRKIAHISLGAAAMDAVLGNFCSPSSTEAELREALKQVHENGQLAALVPQSFLQQEGLALREWLLRKDWIEAVIQLPAELLPQQKTPFALLLINKRKQENRWLRVLFIDARSAFQLEEEQRPKQWPTEQQQALLQALHAETVEAKHPLNIYRAWLKPDRIAEEGYSLQPARYAAPILADLRKIEDLQPFACYFISETPRIWLENQQEYPLLRSNDLSHGFADAHLAYEDLALPTAPCNGQLLRQAALLLNGPADDLRLAYYDGKYPVVVAEDLLLLYPKAEVDPDYLLLRFFDQQFLAQLQWRAQLQDGAIQVSDIHQLLLPNYSAGQQEQWMRDQKRRLLKAEEHKVAQLRRTLDWDKQRAADQQLRIVSSLQHELGNKLPAALNELHTLRDYLQQRIETQQPLDWEQPLFPEWEEHGNHLRALLQRLEYNLHYALDSLSASNHLLRTDFKRLSKKQLDFKDLLDDLAQSYAHHPQFDLEIEVEQEGRQKISTLVTADAQQWRIALENLVENALRHGFSENRRHRIRFSLEQSADGQQLRLCYQNDGKPFPKGFDLEDFIRYGQYAGATGRTGIGGFLIHRIVENHGGSLHWHCTEPPQWPFPVELEMRFPKALV